MKRTSSLTPPLDTVTLERADLTEFHFTLRPAADETVADLFHRLGRLLQDRGAELVKLDVFGRPDACRQALAARPPDWPATAVQSGSCQPHPLAGLQGLAVSGVPVEAVYLAGRAVGRSFADRYARYVYLADLRPADRSAPPPDQAYAAFQQLQAALAAAGLNPLHLVRTWFFNHDILAWYREFNAVRNRFFAEQGISEGRLPASTAIGASNPAAAALVAAALAVQPLASGVLVRTLESPLQGPATAYGSSFSRAVEIRCPDHRRLLCSGTASIQPDGRSAHVGCLDGQVSLTRRVVAAILDRAQMAWSDATRAVAYFRHAADAKALGARSLAIPLVTTEATICRPELLFELEVDAVAAA